MLGINVKRGVTTTLERVFNASGNRVGELEVLWSGKTAGIIFSHNYNMTDVKVIFPSIDEKSDIPQSTFNNMIAYAMHELGHAWFTTNRPWDIARERYGSFVSALINGLEDPRIERKVVESNYAPNSRALFENLVNSILKRDGYVDPLDKKNIPFLLAIEGRRMNGYALCVDSIVDASPWKKDIKWALKRAHTAKDTATIAKIAIELFKRLTKKEEEDEGGKGKGKSTDGQPTDDDGQPTEDGEPTKGEPTDDGQSTDGQPDGNPAEGDDGQGEGDPSDGDEQGDADGSDASDGDGDPSDGNGEPVDADGQPSDSESDGDADGDQGSGKADENLEGGREVEPSDFIEGELSKHSSTVDNKRPRPAYGKPTYAKFNWS